MDVCHCLSRCSLRGCVRSGSRSWGLHRNRTACGWTGWARAGAGSTVGHGAFWSRCQLCCGCGCGFCSGC